MMAQVKKVICKGKSSWKVDYRDPQGKRVQKRFPKKAEAEEFLAQIVISIKEDKYDSLFARKEEIKEIPTAFDELAQRYAEACQFEKSFPTFKARIIPILRGEFGDRPIDRISSLDIETFRNRRRAGISRHGRQRSAARVNRELAVLKHMFNKAVIWKFLKDSPFADFNKDHRIMFREENERLRYLTAEESERLLVECPEHLRPIVKLALNTGMRRGELFALKWENIGPSALYIPTSKSKRPRVVPLNEAAKEVLKEMRRRNELKSAYVFCDSRGKPWTVLRRGFETACRKAGIVDFRFHDLRHTFASHLAMKGYPLKAIAELLGHSTIEMTMRYAHLSPGQLHEAVNSLCFGQKTDGKLLENICLKSEEAGREPLANLV
jgi:integrase